MPITLNNSNISVQYNTGSNYIIETVKNDVFVRDTVGTTSNLFAEPTVSPTVTTNIGVFTHSGGTENQTPHTIYFPVNTTCDILIVGGGGGGGGNGQGGGGGAGSVIYYEGLILNGTYNIKIGKGADATLNQNIGDNGTDSEFLKIDNTQRFLAKGGGGGGTYNASGYLPRAGGSGGGGAGNSAGATIVSGNIINSVSVNISNDNYINTGFTGNRGINSLNDTGCFGNKGGTETSGGDDSIGAGGGGAGEVGTSTLENQTGNKDIAGNGGSGKKYNISGIEKYYGGGGGGGLRPYPADGSAHGTTSVVGSGGNGGGGAGGGGVSVSSNGFDAENGTGGGGGGVGGYTSANFRGGKGGSGIVIIKVISPTTNKYLFFNYSSTQSNYTLTFPVRTLVDVNNNNNNLILQGQYDVSLGKANSSIIPSVFNTSNRLIPLPTASTSNVFVRYHTLNPIKTAEGAQWTYSSSNTNVYHLGSVGIGTTNPEYSLDVRGFVHTSVGGYTQTGSENWIIQSDRRIKENIVKASYEKCLENVKKIELYNFNFKENYVNTNDRNQLGFIAQEVQEVYPKAVIVKPDDKIEDLLTINTTQIKYTLYGAVKSLIDKVENLEMRVDKLYKIAIPDVDIIDIFESTSNISIITSNISRITSN